MKLFSLHIYIFIILFFTFCSSAKLSYYVDEKEYSKATSVCSQMQGHERRDCFSWLRKKYNQLLSDESSKVEIYRNALSNLEEEIYNADENDLVYLRRRIKLYKELLYVHQQQVNKLQKNLFTCDNAL